MSASASSFRPARPGQVRCAVILARDAPPDLSQRRLINQHLTQRDRGDGSGKPPAAPGSSSSSSASPSPALPPASASQYPPPFFSLRVVYMDYYLMRLDPWREPAHRSRYEELCTALLGHQRQVEDCLGIVQQQVSDDGKAVVHRDAAVGLVGRTTLQVSDRPTAFPHSSTNRLGRRPWPSTGCSSFGHRPPAAAGPAGAGGHARHPRARRAGLRGHARGPTRYASLLRTMRVMLTMPLRPHWLVCGA